MINNFFPLFITFFILSVAVNAQTREDKAVGAAVESLRKAMIDADKSLLENLVSEKLSYGHSGGAVEGKVDFVDKIVSGKSDFVSIEITEQIISISDKTAIVRHVLNATINDGGKPGNVKLKVLLVWQKDKGGWKLLARQAVKI